MKLAIYTRISRDPGGTSEAPGRQEAACRAWAEQNGHEVVQVYEDRDVSGYDKKVTRPAFERMLAANHEGILCWRIDRLLRNMRDWARLDELLDAGTVILTEDGTDSRRDGVVLGIKILFAKEESRKTSERLTAQRKAAACDGRPPDGGRRMFGYTRGREVIEEEAEKIREAAQYILSGGAVLAVVRQWNEQGVRTTTGGQWSASVLRTLLSNPTLAGYRVHKGQVYPAQWPPILSESQHKSLQRLFASRARLRPPVKHFVAGLLVCGLCGQKLGGSRKQFKCRCGKVSISVRWAERYVAGAVEYVARTVKVEPPSPDYAEAIADCEQAIRDVDDALLLHRSIDRLAHRRIRSEWEAKLAALERRQQRTVLAFVPATGFDQWWEEQDLYVRTACARAALIDVVVMPPGRGKRDYRKDVFVPQWRARPRG